MQILAVGMVFIMVGLTSVEQHNAQRNLLITFCSETLEPDLSPGTRSALLVRGDLIKQRFLLESAPFTLK